MQLLLNLKSPKPSEYPILSRQRLTLRRAAVKWLLEQDMQSCPAIGIDVPTKGSMYRVDVAAAWLGQRKAKLSDGRTALVTETQKTAVVICALNRHDCWPECADAERLLAEIGETRTELCRLEAAIRAEEPELRDANVLFEEYAVWNYGGSRNKAYHHQKRHLMQLETSLFKGSRLARICGSHAASLVYLAVPKGVLAPEEILDAWGLLDVDLKTLETRLVKAPGEQETHQETKDSLALNIAESNTRQLTDSLGLKVMADRPVAVVRMPTYHRHAIIKGKPSRQNNSGKPGNEP